MTIDEKRARLKSIFEDDSKPLKERYGAKSLLDFLMDPTFDSDYVNPYQQAYDAYMAQPWYFNFTQTNYLINVGVIAVPSSIIGLALLVWNFVYNVYFNKLWASGNPYLVASSVYTLI